MNNTLQEDVDRFFVSFYNSFGFRSHLEKNWFNWFYTQNPDGLCNNYILVDLDSSRWIGGFGFGKKRYLVDGAEVCGALAVNGYINSGYEGRGLYTELIKTVLDNEMLSDRIAFSFPHGNNIPSIKGHIKNGWVNYVALQFLDINVRKVEPDVPEVKITNNIDALHRFDFNQVNKGDGFCFVRTAEHLKWRFFERPDKEYTLLTMVTDGKTEGYMFLTKYKTKEGILRCQIADWGYASQEILLKLIDKARFAGSQMGCHILDVLINPDALSVKFFYAKGFLARAEGYQLLTYSKANRQLPLAAEVTYADFDVI
ncbi:MAG TPA: hypothetical protein VD884_05925 [Ohtaekwangia sp.]|nr:hypothetical protein [Ohtaekwangia sp.]